MNRKYIVILFMITALLIQTVKINTQPQPNNLKPPLQTKWIKTWGGTGGEYGYGITCDSDYIYVVGYTTSYGAGSYDVCILKYDKNGNKKWSVTWGGAAIDEGNGITCDDSYIYVVGYTYSYGAGCYDVCILKYDKNGNQIWNRTWGGTGNDYGYGIACDDSYIYVVGYTGSYGVGGWDICILKYDKDGNKIWNVTWGGTSDDRGYDIVCDGNYIYVVGDTKSYGAGNNDVCILKYDKDGNKIWNKTWGGTSYDYGYGITCDDNYIYISGRTQSYGAGGAAVCVLKYDKNGNKIRNVTWGGMGVDYGRDITCDGNYIYVVGFTYSYGAGGYDVCVLKYDLELGLVYDRVWGGGGDDFGRGVVCGDSVYIVGYTNGFKLESYQLLLLKLDEVVSEKHWYYHEESYDDYGEGVVCNGSYIYAVGYTYRGSGFGYDAILLKYDSSGNLIWNVTWDSGGSDYGEAVAVCGDYVYVVGYTRSFGVTYDVLLLKFNSLGQLIWSRHWSLNSSTDDFGYGVACCDGYVYVVGFTSYGGDRDVLVLKYSEGGDYVWNRTWSKSTYDIGYDIVCYNNYLYVTGYVYSSGKGFDVLLLKYNLDGNLIWSKTWGGYSSEAGYGIDCCCEYLYITGYTSSYGAGSNDVILLKFDLNGALIWNKTWGGENDDKGYDIVCCNDSIYITGYTRSFGASFEDAILLRYSFDGRLVYATKWGGYYEKRGYGVCCTADGVVAVVGRKYSSSTGYDVLLLLYDFPEWVGDTFATFINCSGYLNATVVIGSSGDHGPCGGANAIDTVGATEVISAYSMYGNVTQTYFYLDTDVSYYDAGSYKVYYYGGVPSLTNIITVAGPGVNQISWKYFCNPWYAPVYTYWNSTYGCWIIVTPGNIYKETDWVGSSPLRDLFVVEAIYVEDEGRYVVWCSGFGGYGTRAACYFLKRLGGGASLLDYDGLAIIGYWEDSNNNSKIDADDTWEIIEVVESD